VTITSFRFFHPLTGMTHMSVNSSLSPSFPPSPRIRAAPGDPRRGRALGMGRTRTRVEPGPGAGLPLLPPRRTPLHLGWHGGSRCRLGRPAGPSRGRLGLSPRRSRHQASKAREVCDPSAQATYPIGVFPFFFSSEHAVRGGRRGRHRCVEPRRNAAHRSAADAPRPESATAVTRRGVEAVCAGEEPDWEQERLRRRECPLRREHLRHATVYPRAGHDYTIAPT
jgi:hypothetical protein